MGLSLSSEFAGLLGSQVFWVRRSSGFASIRHVKQELVWALLAMGLLELTRDGMVNERGASERRCMECWIFARG